MNEKMDNKAATKVIGILVIIVLVWGLNSALSNSVEESENATDETETIKDEKSKPTNADETKADTPVVNTYNVQWSDNFGGYETKITKIETEGKELRVYFELFNGSDVTFSNNVEWGHAVINQKQIDANFLGSGDVGGEHLSNTKHEGFVVYYVDSAEDLADLKEIRLTWQLSNDNTYKTKDYDVTIPLK
jgi:FlaG/FlaF family flagellin (archaellin)